MRYVLRSSLMVGVLCLFCAGAFGQAEDASAAHAPIELILPPVQEGFSVFVFSAGHHQEMIFEREPDYAGETVHRSALFVGNPPSTLIGAVYDVAGGVLYVDRNGNFDLTDDGPPVPAEAGASEFYARFLNVEFELTHDGVPVPYLMDIRFYGNYMNGFVVSGWKGEVEIAGKQCVLGVADNLDGEFTASDPFLFEHEKHRQVRLEYGGATYLQFPEWLYFDGQSYAVETAFRVVDGETALAVTLTPITDELMEVTFEGQYVSQVLLRTSGATCGVVDFPQPVMHIPESTYDINRVYLLDSFYGYGGSEPSLQPDGNRVLRTGGPMRRHVSVTRRGAYLDLDYDLLGLGDRRYFPDNLHENRARFAIYQGDRMVKTDTFEYG